MEINSLEFPDLKIYYRFKKMTKNQLDFTQNLIHNIIYNNSVIYEFPPTLDKDFLYNSAIFTLSKQKKEKFIILTKNYDKIYELLKNFNNIANICKKFDKDFDINSVKVIPFFDRKLMCLNEKVLEEASSLDFDSTCTKVIASWVEPENKCQFYNNYLTQQINYENPNYTLDFQNNLHNLNEKKICPFYFYFGMIQNYNPDIIICSQKDYFDLKSRIQIHNLTSDQEYKLIYDECADLDIQLQNLFSMNIDENLLFNASNQLFILKEKYNDRLEEFEESFKILNKNDENVEMKNVNENVNEKVNVNNLKSNLIKNEPENEFLLFNGFPNSNKFSGQLRKSLHFLNLISRILIFFKRAYFGSKNENIFNIFRLQQQFLIELWIDLKSLNYIFKRFILFLNEMKFLDYSSIYHLINFIFFINYLSIYNEGFLLNYPKYNNSDNFYLEFYLIETHRIFQEFNLNKKRPILISGGIGKIEIFEKLIKIQINNSDEIVLKKEYTDDNIKSNIYLTNISNTNVNNNSFYGEIIMKLCKAVPDGIICYFSSISLMEYYIQKWNEQGVFDYIMDDKLLFIEEQDSSRLANIITNFKKSCDMGRGGIFFMSTRNKMSLFDNTFTNIQSRCIIFIGFPIETKLSKIFELRMEYFKKTFEIESKEFLNFDSFRLFSNKISEKILDINDKKVLVVLDERLISDKLKDYLPCWLHKLIHIDFDKENVNTDERLKNIKEFLN